LTSNIFGRGFNSRRLHHYFSTRASDFGRQTSGGWLAFNDSCLHHSHWGCPILAFFARVGGDAACAIWFCCGHV